LPYFNQEDAGSTARRQRGTGMTFLKIALISLGFAAVATPVVSGKIERACNKSDRSVSNRTCSCIQDVANVKLTNGDQALAAKFFKDPQLAQDTRQSDNRSKEEFWKRYKEFGNLAAKHCS
jgi:hypothetical protein